VNELLLQAGVRFRYEGGQWVADHNLPDIWAAGAAAGICGVRDQIAQATLCGSEAAQSLQGDSLATRLSGHVTLSSSPIANLAETKGKCFVCLCEDVTDHDLRRGIAEGFDTIETLKRYSTATMGVCQGKTCGLLATEVCAQATGRGLGQVGTTTSRPPAVPVALGVLAAAQRHHPVRRTPLHHWHHAAGAKWTDAGLWRRPETYGDANAEVQAVRTGVGLFDACTLGKLEVVGPDAAELLERVYVNRWSDLGEGRVRYGVMCNEDGILFDDGVGIRLGEDRYYLTATTGNAEAVFQWLLLWKTTWRLDVTVLNHTTAVAALNLAGPRSRDTLARLSPMDLSPEAFPHRTWREGEVAGVKCRLLRVGFVGEVSYEIHCPASAAWHVWSALYEAGAEYGLRLFGVEAQRVLRLEKGHLILGQDTDTLSTPLEAGLAGLVRFEKPLFLGRGPLERLKERGPRMSLVGFEVPDVNVVPAEGSQVVQEGRPVGRVTSARYSPTLGKSIGLAWVPAASARQGQPLRIRRQGSDAAATVVPTPFYDPEGTQLKG
jgi:sarcosine oxidase subunit alpha